MLDFLKNFKWEKDNFWWEKIRLSELGFPKSFDVLILPDKLMHFLMVFGIAWILDIWGPSWCAALTSWLFFMVVWEIIWDGCFRYGASWKDMIANTLGALVYFWWSFSSNIGQA